MNRFLKIIWLTLLIFMLAGFGYLFYQKIGKLRNIRRQYAEYEQKLALLETEVARLTREIDDLSNNPARLEKLAREKLGMAEKNEKIFIIESTPNQGAD